MAMTFTARSARRSRGSVAAGRLRWCDIGAPLPLGDTAGLAGRLILNGLTLDMDEEGGVHKLGRLLRRKQSDASANLRTGADSRWKSNLIQSVVDAHCGARSEPDGLFQEVTQQRKGEKTGRKA